MSQNWKAPETIEEMYANAAVGAFGGINRPTAGKRFDQDLSEGDAPYQLYSLATPNGQKVAILLEELGVQYDAHTINIMKEEQFSSGFVRVNPNSKIPVLVDKSNGVNINVFETGAILLYLAEKHTKFFPAAGPLRAQGLSWLMWNMGSQGPFSGQFGHFYKYAPRDKAAAIEYGVVRYGMEVQRLLNVLDQQLEGKDFVIGDYSIVDMAIYPWVLCISNFYEANTFLGLAKYSNLNRWVKSIGERPAVQRGLAVCPFS